LGQRALQGVSRFGCGEQGARWLLHDTTCGALTVFVTMKLGKVPATPSATPITFRFVRIRDRICRKETTWFYLSIRKVLIAQNWSQSTSL